MTKFLKLIDLSLLFILLFLLMPFFLIIAQIKSKQNKIKNNQSNNVLFLATGKPIKYAGVANDEFKKIWIDSFKRQLCLPHFNHTYLIYNDADKSEVYRLVPGVIAICLKTRKNSNWFRKTNALFWLLINYYQLAALNKRIKSACVYTNAPGENVILATVFAKLKKLPLLGQVMASYDLSSYSDDALAQDGFKQFLNRNYNKFILSLFFYQSDLVLGFNKYCSDFAIHNGAHPAKVRNVRITPLLFDKNEITIASREALAYPTTTKKNIIIWSRFSSEKKLIYGIQGALTAMQTQPELGLILIGYGSLSDEIERMVAASAVKERVFLLGYKPFHEIIAFINYSDIALIPLGGYALLEAAILKKPIICFDLEWHRELLRDNYNAYIADYANSAEIASKILQILANPAEAELRAERAYQLVREVFHKQTLTDRMSQVVKQFKEEKCY